MKLILIIIILGSWFHSIHFTYCLTSTSNVDSVSTVANKPETKVTNVINNNDSDANYTNNDNTPKDSLKDKIIVGVIIGLIMLIIGNITGYLVTMATNKKIVKMSDIVNRSNHIKQIFINDYVAVENTGKNDRITVGDIVIHNIKKTETLIQQFLFYVSDTKREQIRKHYQEYINPYIIDSRAYAILHIIHIESKKIDEEGKPKPSKYSKNIVPNEKQRSLKYLEILIDDFSKV